jgi:hypothetical protein
MTAGQSATKMDLDRIIGTAITNLAQALDLCSGINDMLLDGNRAFTITNVEGVFTSDKLTALGYDSGDIALIAEAFGALAGLRQLALGQVAQPGAQPTNFFFQAQQLMGVTPI